LDEHKTRNSGGIVPTESQTKQPRRSDPEGITDKSEGITDKTDKGE
jgi:hypothetical protein